MHLLWFDHEFSCPGGSGGTRTYDLARCMVKAGHQVTLVCANVAVSNSGLEGAFVRDRRTGTTDGIHIVEFDLGGDRGRGRRMGARIRHAAAVARLAAFGKYDLIVSTSASLSGVAAGLCARLIRQKPLLFEARSLRSPVMGALGQSSRSKTGLTFLLEYGAYRAADRVVVASQDVAEAIGRRGVQPFKVAMVPYFGDLAGARSGRASPAGRYPEDINPGNLVAVFAGRLEPECGLDTLLGSAAFLQARGRRDISLLLTGDGAQHDETADAVAERQLANVILAGPVSRQDQTSLLRGCDVGLQSMSSNPAIHGVTAPEKFADYLWAGLPVLINYPGWAAGLIAGNDCGYAVRAGDAAALADALEHAADNRDGLAVMGRNARALAAREFDPAARLVAFRKTAEAVRMEAEARAGQMSKRWLDIGLAATALVFLAPVLAVLVLLVRFVHGKPVFYRQTRPGLFGRPIELIRFRTLRNAYRADGGILSDDERRTVVGDLLDASHCVHLPLLWNVLRGDMSFVGPRILRIRDLSRLSGDEFRRQSLRPGLTGWSQIQPPASPDAALARDLWYVDNRSLLLDLKIIAKAILRLFNIGLSSPSVEPHLDIPPSGDQRKDSAVL